LDVVKLQSCIKTQSEDAIKVSLKEGELLGIAATPTLFINGQEVDGAVPISDLRALLDRALEQAGVAAPSHPAAAPAEPQPPSK
jgi:protein-disulfide isomerase